MAGQRGRKAQVLQLVCDKGVPLDDDQIAQALQMNRIYVNAICRQLAAEGLLVRGPGAAGKLVNAPTDMQQPAGASADAVLPMPTRRRRRSKADQDKRIRQLIDGFADYVAAFEENQAFPGPSLYFHMRAIERRRTHQTIVSLLEDSQFLEYVYAVLPAWGMHRMGSQRAKVGDYATIVAALKDRMTELEQLWPLDITSLDPDEARDAAALIRLFELNRGWLQLAYCK